MVRVMQLKLFREYFCFFTKNQKCSLNIQSTPVELVSLNNNFFNCYHIEII
jgi:hypothetical protein